MSKNHHDDLMGVVASQAHPATLEATNEVATSPVPKGAVFEAPHPYSDKGTVRKDGVTVIPDWELFGWVVAVPRGPAHTVWLDAVNHDPKPPYIQGDVAHEPTPNERLT